MAFKIFFCYAHEDEGLLQKLKAHLKSLKHQGLIDQLWHARDISAGSEWETEISTHLNAADIILLLISSAFMNSDYCIGKELRQAIKRHERKEARVIPVILSPVYWQVSPLNNLQACPTDAKPITGPGWHSQDEALLNVVESIIRAIKEMQENPLSRHNYLFACVTEQVNKGRSITEALHTCDPELSNLFKNVLADYAYKNDASLEVRFEKLLSEVSAVAGRDLRVQAEVTADTLGVVADCINYLIYELAKLVILTQKTTAYVTDMSQSMLSTVYQQLEEIESISLAIQAPDQKAIEDIKTSLNAMYTSMTNLTTRLGYISHRSSQLYISVSSYHLPPEDTLK
jgi:methyl-accepting chemotaxis protein